jgi:hypothetical protein
MPFLKGLLGSSSLVEPTLPKPKYLFLENNGEKYLLGDCIQFYSNNIHFYNIVVVTYF